eukprot:1368958-Amphidinium_carterae.1
MIINNGFNVVEQVTVVRHSHNDATTVTGAGRPVETNDEMVPQAAQLGGEVAQQDGQPAQQDGGSGQCRSTCLASTNNWTMLTNHNAVAQYVSRGADSGKLVALTTIANSYTIERRNFIPTMAKDDDKFYNWWMVLTRSQFEQYSNHGTIPGYKDSRGDNGHRHQQMHNKPEYAINLAIQKIVASDAYIGPTMTRSHCIFCAGDRQRHTF